MSVDVQEFMSQTKFFEGYSRFQEEVSTYEGWPESTGRVMGMHRNKYRSAIEKSPRLQELIDKAEKAYQDKLMVGAQRALQYGGDQISQHNARMYNCAASWVDRSTFFGECMYMLLCGTGTGMSVQRHHVNQLPDIASRPHENVTFTIPDSIEGWAQALDVLLSSYFTSNQKFPEYQGKRVTFDYGEIRPKGAKISGGFKAPGPEPLRVSLEKIEHLIETLLHHGRTRLRPIDAYDIAMHGADAVVSGGVRRAATICLFDIDDEDMLNAKIGNWLEENPQRARSNNSAVCVRSEITRDQFDMIIKSAREYGDPGFIFTDNRDFVFNPCAEIGMYPISEDGESGWQVCNLSDINGNKCTTKEKFFEACETAAIIGTLQAGYTDFSYLGEASKKIIEREALIGVAVTGWMNSPDILFDEEIMREGARVVKRTNKEVAELIGINPAARTTTVKPSGNTSVLLKTASGIHPEHSPRYIRNMTVNKNSQVGQELVRSNPAMVEDSIWSRQQTDYIVSFPIEAPEGSIYKSDVYDSIQAEYVKKVQQNWIEEGTNVDLCRHPDLRHNVSNTITVRDWDETADYLFENRQWFGGVSLLGAFGDKEIPQAPFVRVPTSEEVVDNYGDAGVFASGLIVAGVDAFGDLWQACSAAQPWAEPIPEGHATLHKRDFVRRLNKFAENHFGGDMRMAIWCLKDVYTLHRWNKLQREIEPVDWKEILKENTFTDVSTMAGAACSGAVCEFI